MSKTVKKHNPEWLSDVKRKLQGFENKQQFPIKKKIFFNGTVVDYDLKTQKKFSITYPSGKKYFFVSKKKKKKDILPK